MYKISKTFQFDAAHRLTFHKWKCFNVHWHRYTVNIELASPDTDPNGFIKDFSDLTWIKNRLDDNRDHGYIYYTSDEVWIFLKEKWYKIFDFGKLEPTAENMAKFLYTLIAEKESLISKVTIYETPTSLAEYSL